MFYVALGRENSFESSLYLQHKGPGPPHFHPYFVLLSIIYHIYQKEKIPVKREAVYFQEMQQAETKGNEHSAPAFLPGRCVPQDEGIYRYGGLTLPKNGRFLGFLYQRQTVIGTILPVEGFLWRTDQGPVPDTRR